MSDYKDLGEFDVGERVRFRATYRDPDDLTYVDPTGVSCIVWREGDLESEEGTVARDAEGRFSGYFVPLLPGRHFMEMYSTGEYAVVLKGTFMARGSVIPA